MTRMSFSEDDCTKYQNLIALNWLYRWPQNMIFSLVYASVNNLQSVAIIPGPRRSNAG